ncbi:MAG TPA: STAS domain-containing protein [Solirubrobacteraceae bacterium]|nr:STAS domain-containing protein [Solirubrobacteraceae bacterium]
MSRRLHIRPKNRAVDRGDSYDPALQDGHTTPPPSQGSPHGLEVRETVARKRYTLLLVGTLDLETIGTLEQAISRISRLRPEAITLDLRGLSFIDSSGLWSITTLRKWSTQHSIEFRLIPGRKSVHEVFELTGLCDLLPFVTDPPSDGTP